MVQDLFLKLSFKTKTVPNNLNESIVSSQSIWLVARVICLTWSCSLHKHMLAVWMVFQGRSASLPQKQKAECINDNTSILQMVFTGHL